MPFKIGKKAFINSYNYLDSGKIYLNEKIKIFSVHYAMDNPRHGGVYEFAQLHLPQIQYKNPDVHCIVLRNMLPIPMIRAFTDDLQEVIIDVDNRDKNEIFDHVIKVLGKPLMFLEREILAKQKKDNPANFGYQCNHHCMCQVFGQVPCPSIIPVPKPVRGKCQVEHRSKKN